MIQFDPREGDANGKKVRNIVVQQAGFGPTAVRVHATVWPGHKSVKLAKGDVVALEGSYEKRTGEDEDGNERTYHNLSVLRLSVLGRVAEGDESKGSAVSDDDADDTADDEIPF